MVLKISPPVHPGEYLREEMLKPLGLTAYALAKGLKVPRTRVERLVREETGVTPDTALRLARYFAISAEFWLNMQADYDLAVTEAANSDALAEIKPLGRPEAA